MGRVVKAPATIMTGSGHSYAPPRMDDEMVRRADQLLGAGLRLMRMRQQVGVPAVGTPPPDN